MSITSGTVQKIRPYDSFLRVDGALYTSKVVCQAMEDVFYQLDGMNPVKMDFGWKLPMILPLYYSYIQGGVVSNTSVTKLKHLINASLNTFGTLTVNIRNKIGRNILICGFPYPIRAFLQHETDISVKCIMPPDLNETEENVFREKIREFNSMHKGSIVIVEFQNVQDEDIHWANALICDTYGVIRGGTNTLVYLPSWISNIIAINRMYGNKSMYLVCSESQFLPPTGQNTPASESSLHSDMPLCGTAVSYQFFKDVITEHGIQNSI